MKGSFRAQLPTHPTGHNRAGEVWFQFEYRRLRRTSFNNCYSASSLKPSLPQPGHQPPLHFFLQTGHSTSAAPHSGHSIGAGARERKSACFWMSPSMQMRSIGSITVRSRSTMRPGPTSRPKPAASAALLPFVPVFVSHGMSSVSLRGSRHVTCWPSLPRRERPGERAERCHTLSPGPFSAFAGEGS